MKQRLTKGRVTTALTHMVQTVNEPTRQAWSRQSYATVSGDVELTIDVAALLDYLGQKALTSKRGVSRGMSGMIEARVVRGTRRETKL